MGSKGRRSKGCPQRPFSTLTFWDPKSMNHHSGMLSVGPKKGCSVLQHWADDVGGRGVLPTHAKLGQKGCVPISLKSLHTCWEGTHGAPLPLRCERGCGYERSTQGQRRELDMGLLGAGGTRGEGWDTQMGDQRVDSRATLINN